jgi:pimeloyl-ACP methyl ester carboxylesterase
MLGYGCSDMDADQPTSLDVQGRIFAEILEHWGLERPRLVAHDFGGATTLRAHLLHGCEYDRYVLMIVVAMRPWGSAFFDHVGRHVEAFIGLPPHIHEAVVRAYIKGALANKITPDDVEGLVKPWLSDVASAFTGSLRRPTRNTRLKSNLPSAASAPPSGSSGAKTIPGSRWPEAKRCGASCPRRRLNG